MTQGQTAKPQVKLIGEDGNAFVILARCRKAAKAAAWTEERIRLLLDEMMSGDYAHLLAVVQREFEVQ